jgi:hypothetical protein
MLLPLYTAAAASKVFQSEFLRQLLPPTPTPTLWSRRWRRQLAPKVTFRDTKTRCVHDCCCCFLIECRLSIVLIMLSVQGSFMLLRATISAVFIRKLGLPNNNVSKQFFSCFPRKNSPNCCPVKAKSILQLVGK